MTYSPFWADWSNNNRGPIDFEKYRHQGGHVLMGLKATESTHFVDQTHGTLSADAHKHRVHVAHYHFARVADSGPHEQAEHFWEQAKHHAGRHDYFVNDLEEESRQGLSYELAGHWGRLFAAHFHEISGHRNVLYTGASMLSAMGRMPGRKWIAKYGSRPRLAMWAWQRTDGKTGPGPYHLAGMPGPTDVSILNRASLLWLATHKP